MNIKTDWESSTPINYFEIMRIRSNILELNELARQINPNIMLQDMPIYNSFGQSPHLKLYQSIENNIETINKLTVNLPYTKREFPNFSTTNFVIKNWDYNDLNRIENMIFNLYQALIEFKPQITLIITEDGKFIITEDNKLIIKEFTI